MIDFLVFLGIGGAGGAAAQVARHYRRRALDAEQKLARIACTDDELRSVLEATYTPKARALLESLNDMEKPKSQLPAASRVRDLGVARQAELWKRFVTEFNQINAIHSAIDSVRHYVKIEGMKVDDAQYLSIINALPDYWKADARKLLHKVRIK